MRYIFAYRIVGVVFLSLPGASFSKYAVSFSILLNTIHITKPSQIFNLLFSFAFSNNSMTLRLLNLESASPNLDGTHGRGAKDPEINLFMWNQV